MRCSRGSGLAFISAIELPRIPARNLKGITIELDGDTIKLSNALKGVNKEIRDTQSNLKDANKLLKMDPGNADLLARKQKYLTDAIDTTKKKLAEGTKKKIRAAAYCRVSTEQEEQLGSFENQVSCYTELIDNNPEWEKAGIFSDEGISGIGTKKRQGFQNLIRACREGKVDRVITKSISRFARNTADCLHYARELKDLGIPITFQKENIDTMAAGGELLFTILSSLAQEESRSISETLPGASAQSSGEVSR